MNLKVNHHISQCSKRMQKHDQFRIIPIYKIKKRLYKFKKRNGNSLH